YFANDLAIGGLGAWVRYPVAGNSINTLPPPGNAASAHLSPGGLFIILTHEVGAFTAESPFGVKDMAGGRREILETSFPGATTIFTPGGSSSDTILAADRASVLSAGMATTEVRADTGFRIAHRP
ncbi:MAG: hypothetical protein AAGA58_11145, partial [Verrucomicrobiota bacterium]